MTADEAVNAIDLRTNPAHICAALEERTITIDFSSLPRFEDAEVRIRIAFAVLEEVEARARVTPPRSDQAVMRDVLTAAHWRVTEEGS